MSATAIIHKKSAVSGNAPSTSQLEYGELALNTYDGKIFLKYNSGSGDLIAEIREITEDNLAIDSSGLANSSSFYLSGVLSDFDSKLSEISQSVATLDGATLDDVVALTIALG